MDQIDSVSRPTRVAVTDWAYSQRGTVGEGVPQILRDVFSRVAWARDAHREARGVLVLLLLGVCAKITVALLYF